jgi:hypothetical protein
VHGEDPRGEGAAPSLERPCRWGAQCVRAVHRMERVLRAGGAAVGGQQMHTAQARDGGWTQSGGGRGKKSPDLDWEPDNVQVDRAWN